MRIDSESIIASRFRLLNIFLIVLSAIHLNSPVIGACEMQTWIPFHGPTRA